MTQRLQLATVVLVVVAMLFDMANFTTDALTLHGISTGLMEREPCGMLLRGPKAFSTGVKWE